MFLYLQARFQAPAHATPGTCFCIHLYISSYLKLLVLQQLYHQRPHIIHCLLVTHECEQVVKNHYLEVCEHCVASVPGAAASNL